MGLKSKQNSALAIDWRALDSIRPYPKNARKISQKAIDAVARSITEFGWRQPIVVDTEGIIVIGHVRRLAAIQMTLLEVPVHVCDLPPAKIRALRLMDNRSHDEAQWDMEVLTAEMLELRGLDLDLSMTGFDVREWGPMLGDPLAVAVSLADRFGVPPFSVLDARQGYWQDRKRAWIGIGIKSEVGRGDSAGSNLTMSDTIQRLKPCADQALKHSIESAQVAGYQGQETAGTSIFDPVLCELVYRWFCPQGGKILDPFAGGSVRGIVAAKLQREYVGIDLSARQIAANRAQAETICENQPRWIEGDSLEAEAIAPGRYDLVFSCPPYCNLERYSDDPRDLSTMADEAFLYSYGKIIRACVGMLKPDRFACFVVGDVRAASGFYRNFVSDTIAAFESAGANLYNEAILVTVCGSLPIRVGKQFSKARKLGKTHQNVLVFCKGNPRAAADAVGPVECGDVLAEDIEDGR